MKNILMFIAFLLFSTTLPAQEIMQIATGMQAIHLLPSVYIIEDQGGPKPAYSMLIELSDKNLLIVDSPYTKRHTEILLQWIHRKFGKRKMTAINTHYHLDRTGGNEVWESNSIPVYGSDRTVSLLSDPSKSNNWVAEDLVQYVTDPKLKKEIAATHVYPPDHVFPLKQGKHLTIDGKSIEIFYPGPAHTPDNVVVYVPHLKLLFGGCMVVAFPQIYLMSETNINAWPASLARLKKFSVEWVIPGHPDAQAEPNFSPLLLQHTETLLQEKKFVKFAESQKG